MLHRLHGPGGSHRHEHRREHRTVRRLEPGGAGAPVARLEREGEAGHREASIDFGPVNARLKVALLFGGRSGEHEVSLRSAASVASGLAARHDVLPVLVCKAGGWLLQEGQAPRPAGGEPVFLAASPQDGGRLRRLSDARELCRPDVYFPVLHGTYGEDGTVQGLLRARGRALRGRRRRGLGRRDGQGDHEVAVRPGGAAAGGAPRAHAGATPPRRRASWTSSGCRCS